MSKVVWVEASPRNPATALPTPVLLAGGGQSAPYRHPVDGRQFRAGVVRRPLFSARLGFDETGWNGSTRPQTSVIAFSTADAALRAALAGLVWKDAPVTVSVGAEGAAPVVTLLGKVQDAEFTRAGLSLTVIDLSERLERAIITKQFAGSGGIEGPVEAKGRVKRRSWGYVFNVEGRLIDAANSVYEFGDPAFPLTSWAALRDKGREGSFTTVAWQGSIAATLAALAASSPVRGGGVVAPSIACAKWWTQPAGPLTADFVGTAGTGGSMQAAAIGDAISQAGGGPAFAGLAAANASRPGLAGIHVAGLNESFAQAIDRLLLGVSLLWLPKPDGTVVVREWAFNPAAPIVKGIFKGRSRTFPPHGRRRLGFQRNERQHNDSEIAGILLEELTDGDTPLLPGDLLNSEQEWEDVQNGAGTRPADNATVGATLGTNLLSPGAVIYTPAQIETLLGISAGFTGQTAWATSSIPTARLNNLSDTGVFASLANITARDLNLLTGRAWTNLFRANGTTPIADADAITSLGTAAAIAGQGLLATRSSVNLASAEVSGQLGTGNAAAGLVNSNVAIDMATGRLTGAGAGFVPFANNLLVNPNFENSGNGYSPGASASFVNGAASEPVRYLRSAVGAAYTGFPSFTAANRFPVRAGEKLFLRHQARTDVVGGSTRTAFIVYFYDAAGTNISNSTITTNLASTDFASYSAEVTVPAGAVRCAVRARGEPTGSATYVDIAYPYLAIVEPNATVGGRLGSGGNLLREDGSTRLTDASAVTALGTAAAITGQTAWATSSIPTARLNNLSDTGIFASLANITARDLNLLTGRAWTNLFRANGTTPIVDADAITSLGIAASVAGQGSGATANSLAQLNAGEGAKLTGIEAGADVTATAQRIIVPQFPVVEIKQGEAGHTGNRTVTHAAKKGTAGLAGGTWSLPSENLGTGDAAIDAGTGTVTLSGIVQSGAYTVRYTHTDGLVTELPVNVTYVPTPPTATVSARTGSSSSASGVGNTNAWTQVISLTLANCPAGRLFFNQFGLGGGCKISLTAGTGTCSHAARLLVNGSVAASVAGQPSVNGGAVEFFDVGSLFADALAVAAGTVTVSVELQRTSGSGTITTMNNKLDCNVIAT
jgi:hypothetical protein